MTPPVDRIGIPVLAGMGNALMAQPTVRALTRAFPAAEVRIFARNRSISAVFEDQDFPCRLEVFGNDARQFATLLRRVRAWRADVLVVPHPCNRWQYSVLAAASRARRVVMHRYDAGRWASLHDLVRRRLPAVEGRHDVLQNLDLLGPLGVPVPPDPSPAFRLTDAARGLGAERLRNAAGEGTYAAVHAGSGETVFSASKRYAPGKVAALVEGLRAMNFVPVLLEGPEDEGVASAVKRHVEVPTLPLKGRLADAAAVLAGCSIYVGSDSGLAHLAAAVGTPPVTLFGPARPDEVSPWGWRHLVVQTPASCAPCFEYPHAAVTPRVACRPPFCIDRIEVDLVLAKVREAAATPQAPGPLPAKTGR